mgnify:CR=1 FL=1
MESCNSCHVTIDPPGFALESFDASGRWRTTDNGVPLEQTAPDVDVPTGRREGGE